MNKKDAILTKIQHQNYDNYEYYDNKGINELNKRFTSSKGSGIELWNNEIKK